MLPANVNLLRQGGQVLNRDKIRRPMCPVPLLIDARAVLPDVFNYKIMDMQLLGRFPVAFLSYGYDSFRRGFLTSQIIGK